MRIRSFRNRRKVNASMRTGDPFSSLSNESEDDRSGGQFSSPSRENLAAGEEDAGKRLDVFLSQRLGIPRTFAQKLIEGGRVSLSPFKRLRPGLKLTGAETAEVILPPPESLELEPEEVPFNVIYEDRWILVVDKPSGVVVHPAPGNWRGTLVHGLLHRFGDFGPFNNVLRPGIVHRLDATTSGLLVIAREQSVMEDLQRQFRERVVEKRYLALAEGNMKGLRGRIELPVGRSSSNRLRMAVVPQGKSALTEYRVLWRRAGFSFLECDIATGRTHQIRVHLSHIGHPLDGDGLYGADKKQAALLGRVFLHSWKLGFVHPVSHKRLSFRASLPVFLIGRLREILSRDQG